MMEVLLIVAAVIIAYVIFHKISKSLFVFKHLFGIISLVFSVVVIVLIVMSVSVLSDANNFRKNFYNSTNLFVLDNGSNVIVGLEITMKNGTFAKTIPEEKRAQIQRQYLLGDIPALTKNYYKSIVIDIDAVYGKNSYDVPGYGPLLDAHDAQRILLSENAKTELVTIASSKYNLSYDVVESQIAPFTSEDIKSYLFSQIIQHYFGSKNSDQLIGRIKDKTIRVYAETSLFKALRNIPLFIIKSIIDDPGTVIRPTGSPVSV